MSVACGVEQHPFINATTLAVMPAYFYFETQQSTAAGNKCVSSG